MIIKIQNMLESKEQYIVHQTNCTSSSVSGLADQIFKQFSYADCCEEDNTLKLSKFDIKGDGIEQRFIINLFGQYYPGKPNDTNDSEKIRRKAFYKALLEIAKIPELKTIAFPAGIGCGLAQGDWNYYLGTILNFEKFVANLGVEVHLYIHPKYKHLYDIKTGKLKDIKSSNKSKNFLDGILLVSKYINNDVDVVLKNNVIDIRVREGVLSDQELNRMKELGWDCSSLNSFSILLFELPTPIV